MITGKTSMELGFIAGQGGSLEVDGGQYTSMELGFVASKLNDTASLRVVNSDRLTSMEMGYIASQKPGQVTFC